jgi:hypothetical protein
MSILKSQVDMLLTQASSAYIPDEFICEQILPLIGVKQSSGLLGKYGTSHLRIENTRKGGRGTYRRVEAITRSTTQYLIEGHGLEGLVSKEDYKNVLDPFNAERDETMGLTTMLWLEKESLLASALGNTGTLTQNTTLVGTAQLSDYTNSDPISVFKTARDTVYSGCGKVANAAVLSWQVYNVLRFHPKILSSLGFVYNQIGGISREQLAVALGVDKVLIGSAMFESGKEGQTSALSSVWGKNIIFGVIPEKAEPYQISLGYRVGYEGEAARQVYKQPMFNPPGSTGILVEDNYQFLLSNVSAAYLIKNAVA